MCLPIFVLFVYSVLFVMQYPATSCIFIVTIGAMRLSTLPIHQFDGVSWILCRVGCYLLGNI